MLGTVDEQGNYTELFGIMTTDDFCPPNVCRRCRRPNPLRLPACQCGFDTLHGEVKRPRKGVCWFCGAVGRLTKEHPIPLWVIREAGIKLATDHTIARPLHPFQPAGYEVIEAKGKMHGKQPGGMWAPTACQPCNGGWMSALQKAVVPVLRPLMSGEMLSLKPAEMALLARWVAVVVCSLEYFSDIRTIDQASRFMLRAGSVPPAWRFAFGWSDDERMNGGHALRAAYIIENDMLGVRVGGAEIDLRKPVLSAIFTVGVATFHVLTATYENLARQVFPVGSTLYAETGLVPFLPHPELSEPYEARSYDLVERGLIQDRISGLLSRACV